MVMEEASSIASFRSTRLEIFRSNLQKSLQDILERISFCNDEGISSLNHSQLQNELGNSISWIPVCQHHDEYHYNNKHQSKSSNQTKSTLLEEIVSLFLTKIPRACSFVTVQVLLFQAFLPSPSLRYSSSSSSYSTRWSPSQTLLLKAIAELLNGSPWINPFDLFPDKGIHSSHQHNRLISFVYTFAQDFHHQHNHSRRMFNKPRDWSWILLFLRLIKSLDSCLIIEHRCTAIKSSSGVCAGCNPLYQQKQQQRPRSSIKRLRYTLSDLHDQEHTDCKLTQLSDSLKWNKPKTTKFSLQTVLKKNSDTHFVCTCHRHHSSLQTKNLATVLSRAYKKLIKLIASYHLKYPLLSILQQQRQSPSSSSSSIFHRRWMQCILTHAKSPSLRLGLMLSSCRQQPHILAKTYWLSYQKTKDSTWLRFWTELVAFSKYFDIPQHCWQQLFVPLLTEIVKSRVEKEDVPYLLAALAHLLHTRGRLIRFSNQQDKHEFNNLVNRIALVYGQAHYWKLALPQFAVALQQYNILGMVELEESSSKGMEKKYNEREDNVHLRVWPFAELYTLEGAYQRLVSNFQENHQPHFLTNEFHNIRSSQSHYQVLVDVAASKPKYPSSKEGNKKVVPPLLDHLNNDIQQCILRFLNHCDLTHSRSVCTYWKSLIDNQDQLWQGLYLAYFGPYKILGDDESKNYDFRSYFRIKFLTEATLKFQRNPKTAFKHCTCRYLGCFHIFKSQTAQDRHEQKHEHDYWKQQRKERKEEERDRLRQEEREIVEMTLWLQEQEREEKKEATSRIP
jgi:hypothetical protein